METIIKNSVNNTELLYLKNQHLLQSKALVTEIITKNDVCFLKTNITPFYIKSGGQKSDSGVIDNHSARMLVSEAKTLEDGNTYHIGKMEYGSFNINDEVDMIVDAEVRLFNSAYHSAGELIIAALKLLNHNYVVSGAIHYGKDQSRIELAVKLNQEIIPELKQNLQDKINWMIDEGSEIQIFELTDKELITKHIGYFPDYVKEPTIRIVKTWASVTGRPCKGTHLLNLNQLREVIIEKIKAKGDKTIISYSANI